VARGDDVTKILTPIEAEQAGAEYIADAVKQINDTLARGRRWTVVEPVHAEAIMKAIRESGWIVTASAGSGEIPSTVLTFEPVATS
jgi:hypothetical protein